LYSTDEAEKARDYLMKLPACMARILKESVIPKEIYFKWG
jgi:acyl-[acyl-carrier-protein] desaturase